MKHRYQKFHAKNARRFGVVCSELLPTVSGFETQIVSNASRLLRAEGLLECSDAALAK